MAIGQMAMGQIAMDQMAMSQIKCCVLTHISSSWSGQYSAHATYTIQTLCTIANIPHL